MVPVPATPAVLRAACDGYAAGATGVIAGIHQGCLVFTPDKPEAVARWAQPRTSLIVPAGFVAVRA
jgi:hypothetical protein